MTRPAVIAVVNLKGGAGKTTTTAWCAHALHERGRRVLVVDADPQQSALTWHQHAAWPVQCFALPSGRLHREIPGYTAGGRYDAVLIDTPGTEHGRSITLSAVRAATHVLIPSAPTPIEFERLRGLRTLLDEAVDVDAEFEHGVLFNRVRPGTASASTYREAMTADGWRVLGPGAGLREQYGQSFGEPIAGAASSEYGWAVAELLGLPLLAPAAPREDLAP